MTIKIQNKLEVLNGNKILIPNCPPTSAFTSTTLSANTPCTMTVVDLKDALAAVPGSTVIYFSNPRKKFFVLPNGPAQDPSVCSTCQFVEDWYAKLRDISSEIEIAPVDRPFDINDVCSAFPLRGVF